MVRISPARLHADLAAVNAFGVIEGRRGFNRLSFSNADMAARRWLVGRMAEAGLASRMDAVGNVIGRWEVGEGPAVLAGSHLDTVPEGGPLDGALGVIAALEGVRAMRDAGVEPLCPVEVICSADEEGRFGGMLGSQAMCGLLEPGWIDRATADDGTRLTAAMRAQGLDPAKWRDAGRDPVEIAVFLELHIEQGPVLERAREAIGIVRGVSGCFNWAVTLGGAANHSGTTPMEGRRDAFRGMAEFGAAIGEIIDTAGGPETRITIGKAELSPGFPHSIAGEARFSIIGRDPDETVMRRIAAACRDRLDVCAERHGLDVEIAEASWLSPAMLDPEVVDGLLVDAATLGFTHRAMTSGAGHDAQTFACIVPSGLIFIPSTGGISHAPEEHSPPEAVEKGAALLAHAMQRWATRPR